MIRARSELFVSALCVVAGLLFFSTLGRLWPLVDADLVADAGQLRADAERLLARRGFDLAGYDSASRLRVQDDALDYVEHAFGRARTQEWIAGGLPLVSYRVSFKRPGARTAYTVDLHAASGVIGWRRTVEDDEPGPRLDAASARELAVDALTLGLGLTLADFEERSASSVEQIDRRDHTFGYERRLSDDPELREWVSATVAGDRVVSSRRTLLVPAAARREARAAEAPTVALETTGFALLAVAGFVAFSIFLRRLRSGSVPLARAVVWPSVVFLCLLGTYALGTADLFESWEPLWPRWISNLRYLVSSAIQQAWILLVLLAVVAAGDALDREAGAGRGAALWLAGSGKLLDRRVARASGRGFLVGLLCGGVMAATVWGLEVALGAHTVLQPRGFFFYSLNSAAPAATSLLFFFGVALAEELGYRFFGGGWLLALSGRKSLAILVPAVLYGLTHTGLDFLPPAGPFWARPLVLTLVGCVWGWALFRYDALTVVLSHFTADLFIFNWPRLASGKTGPVVISLATLAVPLLPALLWLPCSWWRGQPFSSPMKR